MDREIGCPLKRITYSVIDIFDSKHILPNCKKISMKKQLCQNV